MKQYIAKKPSTFGEMRYLIGQEIPESVIDPRRIRTLIQYGLIEETPATAPQHEPLAETPATVAKPARIQSEAVKATKSTPTEAKPARVPKTAIKRQPKKTTKAG